MRLDSVYIKGFKSFAYPTKLEVADGMTSVVGPNGSGKSNIVDAIKWMLGEHSMKNIRADNKDDVIFGGSEKFPPSNSAEVRLTFEHEGKFLSVSREISRDGMSRYNINKKPSRLRDIREVFKGTGMGKDLYSIVGQGQVDKVVTASPSELRSLIEEAAGTAVYKERKRESLGKLTQTETNLSRVEDILFELGKQRKSLYLKAKRAEKFLEYSEKTKNLRKLFYGNIERIEAETLATHNSEKERIQGEWRVLQKQLIEEESRWSSLRQEFSEFDKEIEGFTQMLENYKKRQNDLLELKEMYTRRLNEKESKLIEASTKADALKQEIEDLEKRRDEIKLISDGMRQQIEKEEGTLSDLEQQRDSMVKNYSEKERGWLNLQEEYDGINKKITKIETEIDRLENNREDTSRRLKLIVSQLESKNDRLETLKEEVESLANQGKESSEKQQEVETNISSAKEQYSKLENELENYKERLNEIRNEFSRSQVERNTLEKQQSEYQGFSRTVREVFKRKDSFEGLLDVVANVIEVSPNYETAVTILLGGRMQDIVVQDSHTAKRIVDFLKSSKIGRATLLPLDMIEGRFRNNPKIEGHPGFLGYAAKLIEVPKGFKGLPEYLFGNSIVVRSLDDAIELRKKYGYNGRIVSIDGQLLSTGGAITGGYIGDDARTDLLSRKRRIQELKELEERLQKEGKVTQKKIERHKDEIMELRGYLRVLTEELNEVISKGAAINRMIHELLKSVDEVEEEMNELQRLHDEYEKRLKDSVEKKNQLSQEQLELDAKRSKFQRELVNVSEQLKQEKKLLEDIQNNIVDLKLKLTTLYEKREQYTRELTSIVDKKKINAEQVSIKAKEMVTLEEETERLRKQVADQVRELSGIKKETENLFVNIRDQREGKEQKLNVLQDLENKINDLKEEREKKKEKLHQLDLMVKESEMKLENIRKELGEVDEDIPTLTREELKKTKAELDDFEHKLKFLGNVDMDAIEEYKIVDEEYQDLNNQKLDLEDARQKLIDLIEKTDQEAKNIFMITFDKINESFKKYVVELFNGGEGNIGIIAGNDLLESGLEISVRRPGRKMQKLQLLSGGEKAIVGIALIFSLLSIKPSPFYVLDEVDAPLDDFNAERLKNMLKSHSNETQFLVITHNKIIMEVANVLHGITMTDGISRVIPVELEALEAIV